MTLNAEQQAVVDSTAALRVVIAGPGSGKTRTLVAAIKAAVHEKEPCNTTPANSHEGRIRIAVMTFTNAGANEFRERLKNPPFNLPPVLTYCGTLHGYCFKLIQRHGAMLGYIPGKVAILPDKERIPRLLACRDKLGVKVSQKALLEPSSVICDPPHPETREVVLIWKEYEFLLKRNNLVDFELILRDGLALLKMPEVRAQVKLDYLMIDEAQDSAEIDWQIYDAIQAVNKMLVGDLDQSIFSFRGANPKRFLQLATYYEFIDRHYKAWEGGAAGYSQFPGSTTSGPDTPSVDTQIPTRAKTGLTASADENNTNGAEVHKLELNYRSDQDLCVVANRLIEHNKERVEKRIIPVSTEPGIVEIKSFEDVAQELSWIHMMAITGMAYRGAESFAVLYRMNHDVKMCRDYLRSMGIPIQEPKYEQRPPDWERALLLLGLCQSPENEILAERFLKLDCPANVVDHWLVAARASGRSLMEQSKQLDVRVFEGWQPANFRNTPVLLARLGVTESTVRLIQQRAELLAHDADLSDLIHALHEQEEPEKAPDGASVYVGTIHSFKGKEADVVFLPAFEQGIIPSGPSLKECNPPNCEPPGALLEEERRLAFVAVTRARHELYISHCAHRRGPWGPVGTGEPSMFVKEMGL